MCETYQAYEVTYLVSPISFDFASATFEGTKAAFIQKKFQTTL